MNSKWRMCHPERNAVRREVEGSRPADVCRTSHERSVVAVITCLFALLLSACTDYQAEFEESFGALEYIGEEYVSSEAGHHGGVSSSDESLPASSDENTSKSSGSVEPSSATSSATPTSGGTEQPSSGAASSQSLGEPSSNSTGSSGSTESSNSTESSSSVKKLSSCNVVPYGNCFEDERDGQTYKTTAEISGLVWMAENLNYEAQSSLCYDKSAENCAKYGRLYEIKSYSNYNSTNLCPDGWHVPDSVEWASLFARVGGPEMAGSVLKTTTGWDEGAATSTDNINFSALPGGLASSQNNFEGMPKNAYFMTSSKAAKNNTKYVVNLLYNENDVTFRDDYSESRFVSVRCVKGTLSSSSSVASSSSVKSSSSSAPPSSSSFGSSGSFRFSYNNEFYDVDYVSYNGLVWMNENLALKRPQGIGRSYNDAQDQDDYIEFFTWDQAKNYACPIGWRLPTSAEFMSSGGLENISRLNGNNTNILKGHYLYKDWAEKGFGGMYWTKTSKQDTVDVIMFKKGVKEGKIVRVKLKNNSDKLHFSVFCVKDDGELAETKERDSTTLITFSVEKVFEVDHIAVQIGTQKWLAENFLVDVGGGLCPNSHNCSKTGYFYTYDQALNFINNDNFRNGGWKLPTSDDWNQLNEAVGKNMYSLLSFDYDNHNGTNEFGFNIRRSGYYQENGLYNTYNAYAYFWRYDSEAGEQDPYVAFNGGASGQSMQLKTQTKGEGFPVRLIWVPNSQP